MNFSIQSNEKIIIKKKSEKTSKKKKKRKKKSERKKTMGKKCRKVKYTCGFLSRCQGEGEGRK